MATPGAQPNRGMTPEQWSRVSELFHQALELPFEERVAWADRTCTIDPDVHREVVSLLENDRALEELKVSFGS